MGRTYVIVDLEKNEARRDCSGRASSNLAMRQPSMADRLYLYRQLADFVCVGGFYKYLSTFWPPLKGVIHVRQAVSLRYMHAQCSARVAPKRTIGGFDGSSIHRLGR